MSTAAGSMETRLPHCASCEEKFGMYSVLQSDQEFAKLVRVDAGKVALEGELVIPPQASSLIVFVHGSGSSRLSPRNRRVANFLNQSTHATLLFDLLTEREEEADLQTARWRFDIPLLADRVIATTDWLARNERTKSLKIGYFGASTGAAAALMAAAQLPKAVGAVVSRGGRPDLAGPSLQHVQAPTMLIVGGHDEMVIKLNRDAMPLLKSEKALAIVPGASHLFEEPGKLIRVAVLARDWFNRHLTDLPLAQ